MTDYILSLDAGTTGVQAALFDVETFNMIGQNKCPFPQYFPGSGCVEHNPNEIWNASVKAISTACKDALSTDPNFKHQNICAIGITNQRETCVPLNKKTKQTPFNALVWQDRRTWNFCEDLKKQKDLKQYITGTTGLVIDPYFSASKMKWLIENIEDLVDWKNKNELIFATIDTFLLWKLTDHQIIATEHTNASRTMLYNIEQGNYDNKLCQIFNVSKDCLAPIQDSISLFGHTKNLGFLPDGIPILSMMGDQQSALFGQQCFGPGEAKITFGTGAFILMNTGKKIVSSSNLISTVACSMQNQRTFALEGSAFIAGAAVQFLRDNFGWFKESYESERLALSAQRDEQLLFVPAFTGLGAPYWNPHARGVLFGLNRATSKQQITRCVLESIALQNCELVNLMKKESGYDLNRIGLDGGASRNNFLMQFQSDMLQVMCTRPNNNETTLLGTALGALKKIEPNLNIKKFSKNHIEFLPKISKIEAHKIISQWQKACLCVNNFYQINN